MKRTFLILILALGARAGLLAQTPAAKDSTIHVIGHAHMDMNWLWTMAETKKMVDDNVRQAVTFMEEYPDFTMLLSQAAVYKFIEENDPALFEKVKQYVREGRLEPVGGTWTQSDQNLSSGEALARAFLLGQRYFREKLGRPARVGWFPDDFGHVSQLPQLLRLAGMNYYYFMRCSPFQSAFNWEGSDGSSVLAYTSGIYNGEIDENLRDKLTLYPSGTARTISPTGVGDHGGGPTQAWIEKAHELDARTDYPHVKFTTLEEFYKAIEPNRDRIPSHKGEMQFIFEGCYSTVAETKELNRMCEQSLYESEMFNTLNWLGGKVYPSKVLKDVWETLVFNEFHDILPGSALYESNRESVARYREALRKSDDMRDRAWLDYIDRIPYDKTLGQPVVAFNLQPRSRKGLVEAEVFSYETPTARLASWGGGYYQTKDVSPVDIGQGSAATIYVQDADGKAYPAQIVGGKEAPPGWRSRVLIQADDLPAGGYKTFYVDMARPGVLNDPIPFADNIFDTDYYRIRIDPNSGDIVSLVDKGTGQEFVKPGGALNVLRIYNEQPYGEMSSWTINKVNSIENVWKTAGPAKISVGPLRATVESVRKWGRSTFHVRMYIYRSYPRIDYDLDIDWLEVSDADGSPMLRTVFPLALDNPRLWCNVPFDVVERPANGKIAGQVTGVLNPENLPVVERRYGQEVPVQKWADASDGRCGFTLMSRSKYGYCYDEDEFRLTLMRCGGSPDLYPNLGRFNIQYAIMPHSGDWKNGAMAEGEAYSLPAFAGEPRSLSLKGVKKDLPAAQSLFSLDAPNVQVTGVKQSEDGKRLIVRLCEMEGSETRLRLTLPVPAASVEKLNILEDRLESIPLDRRAGNTVSLSVRPHEIVTLGIRIKP